MTTSLRPDAPTDVRPIEPQDYAAVLGIYNHYIVHSHCTFDTQPFTIGQRVPWFAQFSDGGLYQCVVACKHDKALGYACSVPFKPKAGYVSSAEVSVYVSPEAGGKGLGSKLYEALMPRLQAQPIHRLYAGVAIPNDASIALHKKFGFSQVAHYSEVGIKFEQFWDVVWLERQAD